MFICLISLDWIFGGHGLHSTSLTCIQNLLILKDYMFIKNLNLTRCPIFSLEALEGKLHQLRDSIRIWDKSLMRKRKICLDVHPPSGTWPGNTRLAMNWGVQRPCSPSILTLSQYDSQRAAIPQTSYLFKSFFS